MKKIIFHHFILLVFIQPNYICADDGGNWLDRLNIPIWVQNIFYENDSHENFDFYYEINPMYLRGDFNGDNKPDVAILVKEKKSAKIGFIIIHYDNKKVFVIGAGEKIGNGGDDFSWMSNWSVKRKGLIRQGATSDNPPVVNTESILVEKAESGSGRIYWDGTKYIWYQQGD